ncbi:hypothetical protein B7494_g5364 [Chlorociboria aeruginascens]|nr:hypothetical protein B7494_g5364 [Chlorociboria aeruginascens]
MTSIPEAKNGGILSLDENIVALIPDFGQIISIQHVSIGPSGLAALKGEYESSLLIHTTSPDFIPVPHVYGSFAYSPPSPSSPTSDLLQSQNEERKHFFLATFHSFLPSPSIPSPSIPSPSIPSPFPFCKKLALFHKNSTRHAPPKFGFHVWTFNGNIGFRNAWCETWEEYFSTAMLDIFAVHVARHRERKEDERKAKLRSDMVGVDGGVTGEGDSEIVAADGDRGQGGVDAESGEVMVFDAGGFWGHNEYELGNWRHERNPFHKEIYFEEYHKYFPKCEPVEDYDDRNALYALKFNLHGATMFPDDEKTGFLDLVVNEMRRLVEKYPRGFEEEDGSRKEGVFV